MRATQGTTYRALQAQLTQMGNRLSELRIVAASGKKLNKPSDDPEAIRPVLNARTEMASGDQYLKTMGHATDQMNVVETQLGQIDNILTRAKEVAINSVNGVMSDENRTALADQIGQMRQELLDGANTRVNNRYIFAGFRETTQPFALNPGYDPLDPASVPVLYSGDGNPTSLEIAPGENVQVGLTGNELFLGDADNNGTVDAGKVDMFAVLTRLEEAIRADDTAGIGTQMTNLDTAAEQNSRLRSRIGNNAQLVETATSNLQGSQLDVKAMLSRYEDADIVEAISSMTQQETAYQAALQVTAQLPKLSILNYI